MGFAIFITLSLACCCAAWNSPLMLQAYTGIAVFFAIICLILGALEFANGSGSTDSTKVASISLSLFFTLIMSAFSAFRLHNLEQYIKGSLTQPEPVMP